MVGLLRVALDDVADVADGELVGEVDRGEELGDEDFEAGEGADEVGCAGGIWSQFGCDERVCHREKGKEQGGNRRTKGI